ncbi:MAG: hypothetical protein C5B59_17330 [Bacteroidetes bacterium]|nr:MAG: hypothetical protein C5B59_17330 [Bacteroidota bacterium]
MAIGGMAFAGGFASGLAGGAQTAQTMGMRASMMKLEQQRANLEANTALANVMRIPVPALRQLAVQNLMPSLRIDPKSPTGKTLIDVAKNGDPATTGVFADMFAKMGMHISPEMLVNMTSTPEGMNQLTGMLVNVGMGNQAMGLIQNVLSGGQAGGTDQGQASTTDVSGQGASPGGTASGTEQTSGGGAAEDTGGQPPPVESSAQPTAGGGMPTGGGQAQQTAAPSQQQAAPRPLASAGIPTQPVPGLTLQAHLSEGIPLPIQPAVQGFQSKIQALNMAQASYPAMKDRLQPTIDELVRQRDMLVNNYFKSVTASQEQQRIGIEGGRLAVAQGELNLGKQRLAWEINKPESPAGQLIHDLNMGTLNLSGSSGIEGGATPTAGGGQPQTAQAGGAAPLQLNQGEMDITGSLPNDAAKNAVLKALGAPAGAHIIQLPGGQGLAYRMPTATSVGENQASESQIALNGVTQVRSVIQQAITAIQKDPASVGLTGDARGIAQTAFTQGLDLATLVPGLKNALGGLKDALPKGYLDYDPNIPQLQQAEHFIAATIAKEMAPSGTTIGGFGELLKKAEKMVSFTDESSTDAVTKLQQLDGWLATRQDAYKSQIGQGGQAGISGPGSGTGSSTTQPASETKGMPRWAKGDKVTNEKGETLYYQGDGSAKGKAWLPTPPQ